MAVEIKKLNNGIPVMIENTDTLSSSTLGIFVKTGAKNELAGEEGISHLLEHMMFKGTTNRTAKEISETIDDEGGIINAYTGKERTAYYVQLLSNKLHIGVDLLTDIFLNSTFSEDELAKEKNVVIEEINMYNDRPEEIVHDENSTTAIDGVHSNSILGTKESVTAISRELLVSYFKERYIPSKMVISVVGNLDIDKLMEQLNNGIGSIECSESPRDNDYNGSMTVKANAKTIKKDTNQIHLCFTTKGLSYTDKDRYHASIISNILGGNMSSRLFQKIREERGLAYSVYSYMSSYEEGGIFTVYAGTTKEDYKDVIDMIKEEFTLIKKEGLTTAELTRAKNQYMSMFSFGLETSKSRMTRMAGSYFSQGRVVPVEEILENINNVSLDEIQSVANNLFDEKYFSTTILGDIDEG